ncbi:hypothetical protein [Clostridium weizhouense]|uniref:Lipoprotein n=1 Tax=Clostridium weizhouense TaxID=2859781 RepID=A0ABS7AQJ4_9CLOT|nr:hypothetical protein [Clostridium weizhouense]MBW6410934.1 hypothetical protein [Clostridium weizhouense]
MKKYKNNIFIIAIIALFFTQVLGIFYTKLNSQSKEVDKYYKTISKNKKYKTLEEFDCELKKIDNINILEGSKQNGKWCMKVNIDGEKQEILECLSYLKGYAINDYIIEHNKGKSSLIIELSDDMT